jgi:hypothetical protein
MGYTKGVVGGEIPKLKPSSGWICAHTLGPLRGLPPGLEVSEALRVAVNTRSAGPGPFASAGVRDVSR